MNKAKALTAYLAERQPAPFDWHGANCTHFAAGYVAVVEQRDPLADYAMPKTLAAARRLQAKGGGLAAMITRTLGRESVAPAFAQLGDVVLLPLSAADDAAQAVGLCCGEQAVIVTDAGDHAFVPMKAVLHAWRVGA